MAEYSTPSLPSIPPLVGREREQAALREALDSALAGRGSLVLIGGEAGVGKTTLAEWALAEGAWRGVLALAGRCYDLTETPPYGPWLELAAQSAPAAGMPPLPAGLTDPAALAALPDQDALFAQVLDWLAALAALRPVVLLLDDLHWADPASLDLLRVVARRAPALPLLLLVAYRGDELPRRHPLYQLLPTLDREARAVRLDLRRLDAAGVRALVAARGTLNGADAERLVAWLLDRAEGNALFTVQLLRALEEEGVVRPHDGGWAVGDLGGVTLPGALRQLLDTRLVRLGDEATRLLTIAAVIGQEVPLALWALAAEVDEDDLLDTIEAGVGARLLVEDQDGTSVRFAHALVREALYQGLLASRRRRVHRRVAEVLAAHPDPDPDAVAYQFQRAGDPRAGAWLIRAGERAQRAYAWASAAARYEAALALLAGAGAGDDERGWLLLRLAALLRFTDAGKARAFAAAALALTGVIADREFALLARYYAGLLECFAGEVVAGVPLLEDAATRAAALDPADLARLEARAAALDAAVAVTGWSGTVAAWLAISGRLREALALGERALAACADRGLPPTAAPHACSALANTHAALGQPDAAAAMYAAAVAGHAARGHHFLVALTHQAALLHLWLPYRADQVAARRELAGAMDAAAARASAIAPALTPAALRAPLLLLEGAWAEADPALARDLHGHPVPATLARALLAWLVRQRGDTPRGWEAVGLLLPDGPGTPPGATAYYDRAMAGQRVAAGLALDAGDLPQARAWLEAHDRWLAWTGAVLGRAEGHLGWAEYHRAAAEHALARQHAEAALASATEPRRPLALLAAHRAVGELHTVAGRHGDAAAHLDAALALADACAAPYERALTLLARAESRAASGERGGATAALDEARAILEPLGARPALARAAALAATLAAPAPPLAYPGGLTAREVEVLRLVAEGLTDAQVAGHLSVSPRTVGQHLRAIYNKLGIGSRAAAARFAAAHGLA